MDPVKRDYHSTLRAGQARQTRRAIVAAATEVFLEHGFARATIDAVAAAAAVSRKTVFTSVGGKLELLKTALDWAITGDDQETALAEREELATALAQDDPADLLDGWVNVLVDVDLRAGRLFRALEVAADADESAADLLRAYEQQRLDGARTVIARLAELGALTDRIRRSDAIDIAWLAGDPALFARLVGTRRWSHRRFRQWLTEQTGAQLLREAQD
ncbi:TetR family transcriptional regulator [Mycobacterium sp. AMU20-3851]|uniref:TetR/AcrR family transcriptional regulator n=1 Tax=Mycobacterium sp. AMU20-3851 TaxID=3122055 RepID=UPI003754C08B